MGAVVETFLFLGLGTLFAILIWHDRPARASSTSPRLLRTFLILLLPWTAFAAAYVQDKGDRLTVSVTQLRVPASLVASAEPDGPLEDYLLVGDRPAASDLVVPSHTDERLSLISLAPEPRTFVAVRARPQPPEAGEPRMEVRIRLQSFAPVSDMELPGMQVSVNGAPVPAGPPVERLLAPDQRLAIALSRLDVDGGKAERRSFVLSHTRGAGPAVELDLSTALRADAGSCEVPQLRLAPMTAEDAGDSYFRDPENLVFSGLGAGGSRPVLEPQRLGPVAENARLCRTSETRFAWPAAVEPSDARLRLVSQRAFLPWYCCIFVTICALATHALCAPAWREPSAERILVPLVQWLLALRLLIAVAGLYNDTSLPPWEVLWDPLAAFLCVPLLLVLLLRPKGAASVGFLSGAALMTIAGFVGIWRGVGGGSAFSIAAVLCYATLLLALARLWPGSARPPLVLAADMVDRLVRRMPVSLLSFRSAGPSPARAVDPGRKRIDPVALLLAGLAIATALAAIRFLLVLVGMGSGAELTERVGVLPLSLVYVPGMIVAVALMLDAARTLRRRVLLWIILAFAAAYIAVPLATRDTGSIFVSAWPLGLLIGWFGIRQLRAKGGRRALWLVPAAMPPLVVLLGGLVILASPVPDPARDLGGHVAQVTQWDRNYVRLFGYFAPNRVEELGTSFAFEAMNLATNLQPLTQKVVGHGYLTRADVRRPLLDNQYSDNLSAIHISWPFGRLGLASMLLVLLAGVAALWPRTASLRELDWLALASAGAGLTFAWSGAYMVMANLNWVPFTGRNVYLLAATSGGDVAEGLALLLLMALPYALRVVPSPGGADG